MTIYLKTIITLLLTAVTLGNLSFALSPLPVVTEVPINMRSLQMHRRASSDAEPNFPDQPPSCPICAANYSNIDSCAEAAPVLANFSMIIFNPGAFIDVIKCACTDTFQSVYPQCVDCFQQTNQTAFLDAPDIPAVLSGIRQICALESTLLGGAATADGEATPTPTSTNTAALHDVMGIAVLRSVLLATFTVSVVLVL
ncbi:hypothetical protein A0H81_05540 [Grifola frondosa]|uniref:Uncharacterized protein n=1 Tax=Grifola frondosa TaxID=5627 RepID=A0A1C7MCT0_GRIFR|nr:hypothetical protein A0H81_05540 [Grifola frondosa]